MKEIKTRRRIMTLLSLIPLLIGLIFKIAFNINNDSMLSDMLGLIFIAYYVILFIIFIIVDRCPYCKKYLGTRNLYRCPGCGRYFD